MDKIIRILILALAVLTLFYASQKLGLKDLYEKVTQKLTSQPVFVEIKKKELFFSDWTEDGVIAEINNAREKKSLSKLEVNPKLNQAALVRLALILTAEDYEGSRSGVTREASLKNVGYSYKLVGDLILIDFFKNNSATDFWEANEVLKETLYHQDFKEMGIAIKNDSDRVSVYVLLSTPVKPLPPKTSPTQVKWGGPELWEALNKRRQERGVGALSRKDELCTIASIRLNQLLELNKLDGHAGFSPVLKREDLKWISEKYNISEYLAQGYQTPLDTVNAWEGTLGHRSLLQGGEFVWGCVYAQNTFAVAITGY